MKILTCGISENELDRLSRSEMIKDIHSFSDLTAICCSDEKGDVLLLQLLGKNLDIVDSLKEKLSLHMGVVMIYLPLRAYQLQELFYSLGVNGCYREDFHPEIFCRRIRQLWKEREHHRFLVEQVLNRFSSAPFTHKSGKSMEGLIDRLSFREKQILNQTLKGLLSKEIALRTGLSKHQVDHSLRNIYKICGVSRKKELAPLFSLNDIDYLKFRLSPS